MIITSSTSSLSITIDTRSLLEHIREQKQELRVSKREQQSLSVLSNHIQRSWANLLGIEPTQDEILELLSLIHIYVLDVDRDGKDELFCKNLLRQGILMRAEQADSAWALLISQCAYLARTRGGLDRNELLTALQASGLDLKVIQSFREDVEQLREYTRFTLDSASSLSKIMVGLKEIRVVRIYTSEIQRASENSNLLVVGEPGAGKSGVLHDLVESFLLKQEKDVVFIAVDRLSSSSLEEEIGLENHIHKVLLNWPGIHPGFLVIDALDGARNEQTAQKIQNLIRSVITSNPRWHVVASVRKFDLRYNVDLKNLFRGKQVTEFVDEEFALIAHINIRDFNEEELEQVRFQSKEISFLLESKDPSLMALLKKPFNLRLVGELIGEGISVDSLTPIRTQVELLSKYWMYRVIQSDMYGDSRELILRRVVDAMTKDHSMRIDRSSIITDVSTGPFLNELLSSHVLIEWQSSPNIRADRNAIAFSHNMLFDYAISRLILSGSGKGLVKKLKEDRELVLVIRPSIVYYFNDLWSKDKTHELFWNAVLELLAADHIPLIGKLIGPSVAVELALFPNDFDFVYLLLESRKQNEEQLAYKIIQYMTGALLSILPDKGGINNQILLLWAAFVERVSRSISLSVAYSLRAILMRLCEQPEILNFEHKVNLGNAARRLLEFAWRQEDDARDKNLIVYALQAVCRTYDSDPAASKALVRHSLEPDHLNRYGYEEMPRLADEILWLINNDAELTEEIYRKVLTHKEVNEEKTSMGGRILGLLSTRPQDFHMAQWRLAEEFQTFLNKSPIEATRSLVDIIQYYATEQHPIEDPITETFKLGGVEAKLIADYSFIWDSGSTYDQDEPIKMLNLFTEYLNNISATTKNIELIKQILNEIVRKNQLAVFWKRILIIASNSPSTLGFLIRSAAWAKPILIGYDTTNAAGSFIQSIYDFLEPNEKISVEEAILSITRDEPNDKNLVFAEHKRDRLLGCIGINKCVLEESRIIINQLTENGGIPPNNPLFSMDTSWSKAYSDEDFLAENGVSLQIPENKNILQLQNALKDFASKYLNTPPPLEKASEILPVLLDLEDALTKNSGIIDQFLKDYAWGYIAEVCERISTQESLSCNSKVGANIKRLLLILANYQTPIPNAEQDEQFSKSPSWGSPAARIDAAAGLILLTRLNDCLDDQLLRAVEKLSKDNVPAVRYQIALRVNVLVKTIPDLMWRLLKYYANDEANDGVIHGLLQNPLFRLAGTYPNEVVELARSIFKRSININPSNSTAQSCVSIFLGLYLWSNHPEAGQQISYLLAHRISFFSLFVHIANEIKDVISEYIFKPTRLRAVDILHKLVELSLEEYSKTKKDLLIEGPKDEILAHYKEIIYLADSIAMTIYFSSGAFSEKNSNEKNGKILSVEEKRIFLNEIGPQISSLSMINHASIIHNLMKTVEVLIPANPHKVFLLVHSLIRAGESDHYQYESMAASKIVEIVERYLAEYRSILRESSECQQALLEILDIFVEVGWPDARKLIYRLEEIYR